MYALFLLLDSRPLTYLFITHLCVPYYVPCTIFAKLKHHRMNHSSRLTSDRNDYTIAKEF